MTEVKLGPRAARLLWPLPSRAHDWLYRHFGGRPARIVLRTEVSSRGKRIVKDARYLWQPRVSGHE